MVKIDDTDVKLLKLLQSNCKMTTAAYAKQLHLSTTAVYERIKRLEKSGIVTNYVALIDREKVDKAFTVLCHIKLIQHIKENVLKFEREILQLDEVVECYHISGDYDYILILHVSNVAAYREFMVTKLTAINNIGSTQSSFVINEVKHTTVISIQTSSK